jgi:hypothetical protein
MSNLPELAYWIYITAIIGADCVSLACIFCGYRLAVLGATGAFEVEAKHGSSKITLKNVSPGMALIIFGGLLALLTVWQAIGGG